MRTLSRFTTSACSRGRAGQAAARGSQIRGAPLSSKRHPAALLLLLPLRRLLLPPSPSAATFSAPPPFTRSSPWGG